MGSGKSSLSRKAAFLGKVQLFVTQSGAAGIKMHGVVWSPVK